MNNPQRFRNTPLSLRILIFIPLMLFLLFYSCSSYRSIRLSRDLDRVYGSLFAGETPSAADRRLMNRLPVDDIRLYEEELSSSRREAAHYLMEWSALLPDARKRLDDLPHTPAPEDENTNSDPLIKPAREAVDRGDYGEAESLYRTFWLENRESLSGSLLYPADMIRMVIRSGKAEEWLPLLLSYPKLEESGAGGPFLLARCLEQEDRTAEALEQYRRAEELAADRESLRRSRWYRMRLLIRENPAGLPAFLEDNAPLDGKDGYYDDLIDDYYSTLVRGRRWRELASLVPLLDRVGLKDAAAQGTFLLMRIPEERYESGEALTLCFEQFSPDPRGYVSLRSYPSLWPEVPGTAFEGETGTADRVLGTVAYSSSDRSSNPAADPALNPAAEDDFYAILCSAGYTAEALELWEERRDGLSPLDISLFGAWLEKEDRLYDLIRFTGYWYYRSDPARALTLLPRLYPGARRYTLPETEIPEELVLGVIRRESAFDASVSSHAGAVGLMQLMPSTAEEVARKNDLKDWDLRRPEDNILMGSLYLQWLKARPWSSSYVDVLAAYNGGGGNLRRWKRSLPTEDPELFIQAIPFRETRNYIRKVIVAAASYRYLETGMPPGSWLEQYYSPF